ncbi:MAG TPA: MbcA/ParS/Xre antitoxin family protein [Bryobacteraceae bacterium]|nr:MbcA/ParS/Xre antitoxin family protein [Bryobacteraceae bacterium]
MKPSVATIAPAAWEHAVRVFGSEQKAAGWMSTPLQQLGERTPAEVLTEDPDSEAVETLLVRIEYVVYS